MSSHRGVALPELHAAFAGDGAMVPTTCFIVGSTSVGKKTIKLLLEYAFDLIVAAINHLMGYDAILDAKKLLNVQTCAADVDEQTNISSTRNVILLGIYDICQVNSAQYIASRCRRLKESNPIISNCCLVGNKIDLEYWRVVTVQDGYNAAKTINASFVEISAFSGQHIDILLDTVLTCCFPKLRDNKVSKDLVGYVRQNDHDDTMEKLLKGIEQTKKIAAAC